MEKTLGIDLGTNSIGWAIRDTSAEGSQIVGAGVLTFEKGVGEVKGIEVPKVQARTSARSKRRNYQAEKYRKWALLKALMEAEPRMCPLTDSELDGWRKYVKGVGRKYPTSEPFLRWLRYDFDGDGKPDFAAAGAGLDENHFLFRALAVSEELADKKLFADNPQLLGRVFYHMVQRRGFRGRDDESEEAKTILKGSEKAGTAGVEAIQPYLEKYKTLGAALYHLQRETGERIRKRYNLRTDYEAELAEICRVQGIGEELAARLKRAIVWQRPLRSQKGLVGYCTFETPKKDEEGQRYLSAGKKRCPISHPLYEEFRTWQHMANLKVSAPAGTEHDAFMRSVIYPAYLNATRDFTLNKLGKLVRKQGGTITSDFAKLNETEKRDMDSKERSKRLDEKEKGVKVVSATLLHAFDEILGKHWKERYGWNEALRNEPKPCPYSFEDLWHVLMTFDSREKLKEFATEKLHLPEDKAEAFSKIKLQQGYATLSLSAIRKILPYLYEGFIYSEAVFLANIHKVLGGRQLSPEETRALSGEIKTIISRHRDELQQITIVNDLIADGLNSGENRFGMEASYRLDDDDVATVQAKVQKRVGLESWQKLDAAEQQAIYRFASQHYLEFLRKPVTARKADLFLKPARLHEAIGNYLKETYGATNEDIAKHLWHPSEQEAYPSAPEKDGTKLLGDPQPISRGFKNPMALKTLHKLKGLINYLLLEGKIDEDTRIVVEIARELNDANKRRAIERYQREREKENDEFRKRIAETASECGLNINPQDPEILARYRLWVEQRMHCLYTGKAISVCDLFHGAKFDFEHTVPASMSFDNELKNLTIADAMYNRQVKGNKLPAQLPNYWQEATVNGVTYPPIKPGLNYMEEKVEELEKQIDEYRFKAKIASTKEIKDASIQRRHMLKFELDYWRSKLRTFTDKEYKAGWRNSQLRDTQIITKYALPYLKTVFKKVEVEKGARVADFRKIYKVQPKLEKKDRTKHSHHAIDAAVLTLIPPASIRDRILQRYNEEKDKGFHNTYHEPVRGWANFKPHYILDIEDSVLINFQAKHRTLKRARKKIRKRGKQQHVYTLDANGKKVYKLDEKDERIPIIAQGDTIRGQLHKESLFGAIKMGADTVLVERYPIATFTSIADCKNIVDAAVRELVQSALKERMDAGQSFDQAKLEPVPFPSGKAFIKKVRCKVAAGRGYLKPETALEVHTHAFPSKHEYKQHTYAQNEENALLLYYEAVADGKTDRAFRIVGLHELAGLRFKNVEAIREEPYYQTAELGIGKKARTLPLKHIIQTGCRVIFYKDGIDELKELPKERVLQRLYRVFKFNLMGPAYVYLQHHLEARPNDQLGGGETTVDLEKYQARLTLIADKFSGAIEGLHFKIQPDGSIVWLP